MGDAQSAQRDAQGDAEQSGQGGDAETGQSTEDKPLENKEPTSGLNGKADGSLAGINGHSVDAPEGIPSPGKEVSNVEMNAKELPDEEEVPVKMIEMEAKQNEINESFRRFFSNIGLKLTVKKDSGEKGEIQVPEEEPDKQEDVKDTAKESENTEHNKDLNAAPEAYNNDSTTSPTMTDGTSEVFITNTEEKATETKQEAESNEADAATTSPVNEGGLDAATEEVVASPFKRFFKTGIFSGLRKKRKEPAEKELVDMGKKETMDATEQTVQDQQQHNEEVETATVWKELQEIKPKDEIVSAASAQTTDEAKSPSTDPSVIIVTESEILSSQEKVQASPMKRLLSGSSLKRLSKKQRDRKLSDGRLSDSGEHSSDQLMSSTESADNPREDSSPQSSAEATGEEEGPWASFKRLMTPKKRMKGSFSGHEEAQVPASVHDAKPSEGEKISDHSSEEGRKRKDSSVSWEAVLCGSGRRRSRKTSDSEDESPPNDNADNKQDSGAKQSTETQLEGSNEVHEIQASSSRQTVSPPEGDGGSTWKSFKKLVTPKRKAKDEDETKDYVHSDNEMTQDDSSFSIKKLLPGRKKRKSGERQDQVSSDEAEKDAASGDEDSETPAVVPLSEFDAAETGVQIQTQADIESYAPKELEDKLQQDLLNVKAEPAVPCDDQQVEAKEVQDNEEGLKKEASEAPVRNEEPDEELISKHQQLSDITEEGAITDTMATPASTNEEAARDDTIADDLIEITSEAITAPEPVDVTLADETEMISAVSQLSESSKTSGNTTPVPAELDVQDTELLLQNVAENIQMSQEAVPVCSEDPRSEKEHTGQDAEATDELASTAQTESVSDTNEAMSTDIVSEVPTEEFDTAEIIADEAYKEDVSQLQDTISEYEVTEESEHPVESVSEVNEAVSVETLPEGAEVVPDSLTGADEAEISKMDSQEAEPAPAVADETKDGVVEQEITVLAEKEDQVIQNVPEQAPVEDQPPVVANKQEVLAAVETDALPSKKDIVQSPQKDAPFSEDILPEEKVAVEPKQGAEHLTEVIDEPEKKEPQTDAPKIDQHEVTEVVQTVILDSEEGSVLSLEKEVTSEHVPPEETLPFPEVGAMLMKAVKTECIQEQEVLQAATLDVEVRSPESFATEITSDDVPPEETVRDEPKEERVPLAEVNVEPVDTPKTEHIQEPETLQALTLDSEIGRPELPQKEVISDNVPPEETVIDEPKEETVPLADDNVEPVDCPKTKHIQKTEIMQAVPATTLDSEAGSPQVLEKEVISEDVAPKETVKDEPKEEPVPLVESNVKSVDASKTEHLQEPETLQAITLDSEAGSPQLSEKEVISEDFQPEETVRDEPKEEPVPLVESNVKSVDASKTEHLQEPEKLQLITLDSEAGIPQICEKEVILEDVPPEETVRDEPKVEPAPLEEGNVESLDASKAEHIQEPETLQAVTLDTEAGSPQLSQTEVILEDILSKETIRGEPKEEPVPIAEVNVESGDACKTKHIQEPEVSQSGDAFKEPEVLQAVQAATLDSVAGGPQLLEKELKSEDVPLEETIGEEPKEETVPLAEVNVEAMETSNTEHIQKPKVLKATTLDSEAKSSESLKKEVIAQNVPPEASVRDEPKQETVSLDEVNVEPVDASKTEHIEEPQVSQITTLDSEVGSPQLPQKEVTSEDVPPEEMVREETKEEPVLLAKSNIDLVDLSKAEHIEEPEALQATTLDSEANSHESPKKEVTSEDVPPEETVGDEPKEETLPLVEVNVQPVDASKEPEALQAVQGTTSDSEAGGPQLLEKEVTSEDVLPEEMVREEPKEEPVLLAKSNVDSVDASKTEHIQGPEALQAATLDSEAKSNESFKKEITSEDVPPEETAGDEPKEETLPLVEVNVQPVDASKEPEALQAVQGTTSDSEAGGPQLLEKEVTSEDVLPEEMVREEPKEEPVLLAKSNVDSVDASKTEHIQGPEALQAATLDSEANSHESLKKEVTSEDVPPEETVGDEPKEETVTLAEVNVQPVDASKEPEALQAVQGTTSDSEAGGPQLLEKEVTLEDVLPEEMVREEPKEAPEISVEPEEPLVEQEVLTPDVKEVATGTETGAAAPSVEGSSSQETQTLLDDAPKPAGEDVIASVPDETEKKVVDQALETINDQKTMSLPQSVEVEDNTTEVAEELESSPAVNVPSVTEEASCVQILEETVLSKETPEPCADSAEASDEPTHKVQVNGVGDETDGLPSDEMKTAQVQHVIVMQITTCNEKDEIPSVSVEKTTETHEPLIDRMAGGTELKEAVESATPLVEDGVEVKDDQRIQVQVVDVDIKSVIQVGVTEQKEVADVCCETIDKVEVLSATSEIEDEVLNKETKVQEAIQHEKENLPGTVPESLLVSLEQEIMKGALTEVVENESNQAEDQKEVKDSTEMFTERQDEESAVTSDDSAITTEHHVSEDHMQTSEIPGDSDVSLHDRKEVLEGTKEEDKKCSSEKVTVKKANENTTEPQQTTQIATTSDTGLVAPHNTGIISSVANMDSPSSCGQTKAPESPSPPADKLEPLNQTDVSDVSVQLVEAVESINATEKAEKQIMKLAVNLDSNEGTKIAGQAAQLDVDIQAMETTETEEEVTSAETVTPNVQAAETIQSEMHTDTREAILSQPALCEAKAEEPTAVQKEEENDEDVWLDAEEQIYTQEERAKVKEPREQDEKAGHEQETQQEMHKTEGTPESEGEQFAVALEHPETVTASDSTMDLI